MVIVRVPGAGGATRVHGRAVAGTIALCGAAFLAFAWSLSVGDYPIALSDVLATLFGGGNEDTAFIIRRLRLPRGLTAALVGAGFGLRSEARRVGKGCVSTVRSRVWPIH